ncbi:MULTISPECIES: substrate-binding domain-containing protein [Thermoanaerobacterium]|uniref:Ribose transport system substrate-binding protein n=1 Tax=Thermoanaerobacterium butyriciformans TaxID=1702242 RepID=A0ABS4NET4_9THEO|nr:substrate-binding domain-containing protein [Thermoanaerobacterium sp. CMT5567-10]MBP2071530.1 ribose transport system substrate-binding protein [Thermoanaerobacterium butyriciformans]WKV10025.1 substrate-binding domain-containing protein [Thermoanaerobacterium sp. CMT5567-10]
MKTLQKVYAFLKRNIILILMTLIAVLSIFLYKFQQIEEPVLAGKPSYHFYLVAQNSVDPFWKEVQKGAEDAAKFYNVAVEFNAPKFNNLDEELEFLDIAVLSKVDGIITHVSYDGDFNTLINEAYENKIPVVTIENDLKDSKRKSFVGANSFILGEEAGKLMKLATGGKANIAVIMSNDVGKDTASQNLKLSGFLGVINSTSEMKVSKVYTSQLGALSAEEITQSIINGGEGINALYITDSVDTIGAAQVVVDFSKVGEISIVGYGDTPDILRYVDKGIIYGTVMSDPYKMGYESVKAMMEIKKNNEVSTFIDTGVNIITKSNVKEYEDKIKQKD